MIRKSFYETTGVNVQNCSNLEEVLKKSGLNYTVEAQELYLKNGTLISNKFANVIKETNTILGIVGKDYNIIQNSESFGFIKKLENNYKYYYASDFNGKKGAILILKNKNDNLLINNFSPFVAITNRFDGIGNIDIIVFVEKDNIPIYINSIKNPSIKHSGLANLSFEYCEKLEKQIEEIYFKYSLILKDLDYILDDENLDLILTKISYKNEANTRILIERANNLIEKIKEKFQEQKDKTALSLLLAVADYEINREQIRNTSNNEIYLQRFLDKMDLTNRTLKLLRRSK